MGHKAWNFESSTTSLGFCHFLSPGIANLHCGRGIDFRAIEHISDSHAAPDAGVLMVGDARTYYIERRALSSTVWDKDVFLARVAAAADGRALAEGLVKDGWEYLVLNMGEALRLNRMAAGPADVDKIGAFFRRHATPVFAEEDREPRRFKWCVVYRISAEPSASDGLEGPLTGWLRQKNEDKP